MTALDIIPDVTYPPTDLWSDEPPLESDLHLQQIIILLSCLELLWRERSDYYASGNLTGASHLCNEHKYLVEK